MQRRTFKAIDKASLSLTSAIRRRARNLAPNVALHAAGFRGPRMDVVRKEDPVLVLIESSDDKKLENRLPKLGADETIERLASGVYSAKVSVSNAEKLLKLKEVRRMQTKKRSSLRLDFSSVDLGVRTAAAGPRKVSETGKGVLLGIVDSGFDLSHPMFRDGAGKLRVAGLLDQNTGKEFNTAELESHWTSATNPSAPGGDENGHGTHVAAIAGATKFNGFEGVAPGARFLLVKTNFLDTADAVQWIFNKADTLV